jgi:hypothetical protein
MKTILLFGHPGSLLSYRELLLFYTLIYFLGVMEL